MQELPLKLLKINRIYGFLRLYVTNSMQKRRKGIVIYDCETAEASPAVDSRHCDKIHYATLSHVNCFDLPCPGPSSIGGGGMGGSGVNSNNVKEEQKPRYSIPGILHFIQHEWAKFEMERSSWDLERAELQARIAFLQGERKGQDNLKNDLVRRIKMLEYALKQER